MSDEQPTEAQEQVDPAADSAEEPKTFDADYVKGLRAEAAKYRTQAKENAEAAKRLAEIEESNKSEAQKHAERLEAAEKRLAEYERREQVSAWADEVSKDTGVPAAALRGSSLEEMQAHAETLKSLINPPKGAGIVPASGTGGERVPVGTVASGRERARAGA